MGERQLRINGALAIEFGCITHVCAFFTLLQPHTVVVFHEPVLRAKGRVASATVTHHAEGHRVTSSGGAAHFLGAFGFGLRLHQDQGGVGIYAEIKEATFGRIETTTIMDKLERGWKIWMLRA